MESNICIRFKWLLSIRCIAKIFLGGIGYSHLFWCTAFDAAHSDSLYPIWPISATYLHNKNPNMFCPKTKTTVDLIIFCTYFVDFKWLQKMVELMRGVDCIKHHLRSQFWITNVFKFNSCACFRLNLCLWPHLWLQMWQMWLRLIHSCANGGRDEYNLPVCAKTNAGPANLDRMSISLISSLTNKQTNEQTKGWV